MLGNLNLIPSLKSFQQYINDIAWLYIFTQLTQFLIYHLVNFYEKYATFFFANAIIEASSLSAANVLYTNLYNAFIQVAHLKVYFYCIINHFNSWTVVLRGSNVLDLVKYSFLFFMWPSV